jgi:hypothetical protein
MEDSQFQVNCKLDKSFPAALFVVIYSFIFACLLSFALHLHPSIPNTMTAPAFPPSGQFIAQVRSTARTVREAADIKVSPMPCSSSQG